MLFSCPKEGENMVDGSITINTKIDDKGIAAGLRRLKSALIGANNSLHSDAGKVSKAYINAKAKVEELEATLRDLDAQRDAISAKKYDELKQFPYSKADLNNAIENALEYDKTYIKLGDTIKRTENKLTGYKTKLRAATEEMKNSTSASKKIKPELDKIRKSAVPLTKSIFTVANMFKLMALRMVVRAAINAVKKGFQDLAKYSDSFNSSMSALSTAFLQARNALSTAFAPMLQAITPLIIGVTDVLIDAFNAVGALSARLFSGSTTYIRAKKAQVDYAKSLKDTNEEMKRQAMGFDEMNILADENSDTGTPSYKDMFEEVEIPTETLNFADSLKENLGTILDIVLAIGAGFVAWKITDLFGGAGAAVGLLVTGITLLITGITDWITTGELSEQTFWQLEAAIIAVGIALAILIEWPALLIAAIVAVGLAIYYFWDEIVAFLDGMWKTIVGALESAWTAVANFFVGIWNFIVGVFSSVGKFFGDIFTGAWNAIKNAFSAVGGFFAGIWNGIKSAFNSVVNWFKDVFTKAWTAVKNVFSTGGKIFMGIVDGIANVFKTVVNAIIDGINFVIALPFKAINGFLNMIHDISIFGFQPFASLWARDPLPIPKIPKLATGAVIPPNAEFLAVLGDQKQGRNIEAPEGLIRQIVREESGQSDRPLYITVQIGTTKLGTVIIKSLNELAKQNGGLDLQIV